MSTRVVFINPVGTPLYQVSGKSQRLLPPTANFPILSQALPTSGPLTLFSPNLLSHPDQSFHQPLIDIYFVFSSEKESTILPCAILATWLLCVYLVILYFKANIHL